MSGPAFAEAIAFLVDRLAVTPAEWLRLVREVDAAARDRSTGMTDAMVRDILEAIKEAISEGETLGTFRKDFASIASRHGWTGPDGVDPAGWRSELIFRTATAQAMAAGRWRQIPEETADGDVPYLRYITAGDHRVREAHRAWNDLVLPADHPWWKTHFPPNGWNCRCHVQILTKRELMRFGLKVGEAPPDNYVIRFVRGADGVKRPVQVPAGIDPGFAFNPGEIGMGLVPDAG